jgi:hypothetical protein
VGVNHAALESTKSCMLKRALTWTVFCRGSQRILLRFIVPFGRAVADRARESNGRCTHKADSRGHTVQRRLRVELSRTQAERRRLVSPIQHRTGFGQSGHRMV